MQTFSLNAETRTLLGKVSDRLRRQDKIPAVVYGHGIKNVSLTLDGLSLQKVFRQAGSSSLVDLVIDGKSPVKVLIQDVQLHPTTVRPIHADFYQVRMTEKIEVEVELHLVGESPAVKEQGGILVRSLDKLKVSCLPADLVPAIDVDISKLATFEDRLHVSDLVVPPGLTILDKGDEVVVSVTPPRSEEELAELEAAPAAADVSEVEVVKKEKGDEEEPAEEEKTTTASTT